MEFALITGATSGIGYELANLFAQNGYGLILVSSSQNRLNGVKEQLQNNYNIPVYIFQQDLSQSGAALKLYQSVTNVEAPISVLVNNAGFGLVGATDEIDWCKDEQMITLNVLNLVSLCKLIISDMYKRREGKILNVASTGAFQPGSYTATYFASKAFVLSYSREIRYEAKQRGVQVSTLCPGATRTNFFRREGTVAPANAMPPDRVASIAFRGLMKSKEIIIPGIMNKLMQIFPLKVKMLYVAKMKNH